jgi:hypothetical protein
LHASHPILSLQVHLVFTEKGSGLPYCDSGDFFQ